MEKCYKQNANLLTKNTRKSYEKNLEFNVAHIPKGQRFSQRLHGLDPIGTSMKLVWVSLVFTWDPVDPVWIRSALWYQMGPLMKVIPYGTILFKFEPVLCKQIVSIS